MSNVNIGDPYRLKNIYGRVVGFDGGIIHFATPHGSIIELGFFWFARDSKPIIEWEDLNILFDFEQQAITYGAKLYGGRLAKPEVACIS